MKKSVQIALVFAAALACAAPAMALAVTLQPIRVCNDAGAACANSANTLFEAEADKIWAQAGIDVIFNSFLNINETDYLSASGSGTNPISGESVALLDAAIALNNTAVTLAINLIFVNDFTGDPGLFGFGCGAAIFAAFCANRTGIIVADNVFAYNGGVGRLDTIAHELGHVLGLEHTATSTDLMASGGVRTIPGSIGEIYPDGADLDQLDADEIATALDSQYVVETVPEPSTMFLFGLGLIGAVSGRRKRAC